MEQEIEEKGSLSSSQGFKRHTSYCFSLNESFSDNRSNHSSRSSSFYNFKKLGVSRTAKAGKSIVECPGLKAAPISIFPRGEGLPPQSPKKSSPKVTFSKKELAFRKLKTSCIPISK
jgi:hypothetical protein